MRILVISDTHGDTSRVYEVYNKLLLDGPVDMIVHLGDLVSDAEEIRMRTACRVAMVSGNCDGSFDEDDFSILETEAGDFLLTHGHMERVDYSMQKLYYKAQEKGCIGALFGHTHRSCYVSAEGMYLMNPGSLSKPRDNSGGTFGVLITSEGNVWGKIYNYEDYMKSSGGSSATGKKPKVQGGRLRSMINYSDRF